MWGSPNRWYNPTTGGEVIEDKGERKDERERVCEINSKRIIMLGKGRDKGIERLVNGMEL